jgi:peptidoglycan/LPS O-acetylase OafA/YrhL
MTVAGTSESASASASVSPPLSSRTSRRTDLDSLRIVICGLLILAHALLIFAAEPRYHLKAAEISPTATVLYEFTRASTTAVFFAIAGWAAVASLRRRGSAGFVRERATRLLVPMAIGSMTFGCVIKYIELKGGRDISLFGFELVPPLHQGFLEFLGRYPLRLKLLTWSQLWFLGYLFLYSVLLLPWLLRLARAAPSNAVPAAPVVYLPGLAVAAWLVVSNGYWPYLPNLFLDWANFGFFLLCFALGAWIAAWPGFETRLRSEAPRLAVLTMAAFAGLVLCGESTAGRAFVGLTAWFSIGAALGIAARVDPRPSPTLSYLSEATLPVYIIHNMILLLIGVQIVPLPLPVGLKIVLIAVTAIAVSLAAYHWLIRPWPAMRWAMGMAPLPAGGATITKPTKQST